MHISHDSFPPSPTLPTSHVLLYEDGINTSARPTKSCAKGWLMCTARGQVYRQSPSERLQPVETETLLTISVKKSLVSVMSDLWIYVGPKKLRESSWINVE